MNFSFKLIATCFLSLAVIFFAAIAFCLPNEPNEVSAANSANAQLFLPATELEHHALSSPNDIYSDEKVTAIIQKDNTELVINYNGKTSIVSASKIFDVARYDDDSIIVSSDSDLHVIKLSDASYEINDDNIIQLDAKPTHGESVSYFDINDNYLVTAYQTQMQVYIRQDNSFTEITDSTIPIVDGTNVSLNNENTIFYVCGTKSSIHSVNISSLSNPSAIKGLVTTVPDRLIADEDFVYYIYENSIYRKPVNGGEPIELKLDNEVVNFDLGKFSSPKSIALKNKNLLVVENDTIQEFRVNDSSLEFTGYAIAKGKTAYNRVDGNCSDVEKYGDTVAVLDGYKLTVVNTKTANLYDRSNFKNYLRSGDLGNPNGFALGNGKVLTFYGNDTFKVLDLSKNEFSVVTLTNNHVYDACYQSGKFYVYASPDSNSRAVYEIDENDTDTVKEIFNDNVDADYINVDVFGNVYLASDDTVYEYEKADGGYRQKTVTNDRSGVKKVLTDIGGTLYLLDNQGIWVLSSGEFKEIDLTSPTAKSVTSFALDFVTSSVYFTFSGEDAVCVSNDLGNLSLEDALPPAEYITNAANADIDSLKIYKPTADANVYSVTKTQNAFKFNGLIKDRNEYVYICPVTLDNGVTSVTLYALAGQTETVLVNEIETAAVDLEISDCDTEYAYTTTGVNAYYIPIMTTDTEYSLVSDGNPIRLSSGTKIKTEKVFTYLGSEYYYASVEIDGETYKGYIPTSFTVFNLAEDFELEIFTYEKVNSTTLYLDAEMNSEIATLDGGTTVKLYAVNDGVATVAAEIDGVWTVGYINAKDIKNEPSRAVRNALIIIAVAACLSATTAYFILKKKD